MRHNRRLLSSLSRVAVSAALLGVLALHTAGPASAQSMGDIENRLARMQNDIETLSRSLYKGEAPPSGAAYSGSMGGGSAADVEVRLQQMETQLREITGKVEEQSYAVEQVRADVDRRLSDMEMRMNDLEGRSGGAAGVSAGALPSNQGYNSQQGYSGGMAPPQPAPSGNDPAAGMQTQEFGMQQPASGGGLAADEGAYDSSSSAGMSAQPASAASSGSGLSSDSAAANYENAFSLMKSSNYDSAQREFETFLQQYPDHALAGNAQYWLGETFYVQGNYEKAARIFAEGYQKYPQGSKAADNLLKLGLSLASIGNKNDACVALRQLKKDFTTGAGPALRRADQEMTRLGC